MDNANPDMINKKSKKATDANESNS